MLILVQIDKISSLKQETDTSLHIINELKRRNFTAHITYPERVYVKNGEVWATVFDIDYNHYKEVNSRIVALEGYDVIMVRQDPPFNLEYLTNVQILNLLKKPLVLNSPNALMQINEKLVTQHFAENSPDTIITADKKEAISFLRRHKKVVLKSLYGFGGKDVFLITEKQEHDVESAIKKYGYIVLQQFIVGAEHGDKRVIIIDGEVCAVLRRIPKEGDFRSNMSQGGTVKIDSLTTTEQELCSKVAIFLQEQKVFFAGLDIMQGKLMEVNITSPTCLKTYDDLTGKQIVRLLVDKLEAKLLAKKYGK